MSIVQRHILRELLGNSLVTMAVVAATFFIVAVALAMGQSRFDSVPLLAVLTWTGWQVVGNVQLAIPLALLVAVLITYGRVAGDGEYDALRTAGVHPLRVALPALVLGAAGSLALAFLLDEVAPTARYVARRELAEDLLRNLDSLLQRSRSLSGPRWKAAWAGRRVDAEGRLVLDRLDLLEYDGDDRLRAHTSAAMARPLFDPDTDALQLELADLKRVERDGLFLSARSFTLDLPFAAFAEARLPRREDDHRSGVELAAKWRRREAEVAWATSRRDREALLADAREARAAFHGRAAAAGSAVLFALFGVVLGLGSRLRNRALTFLVGFLAVIGIYYPLSMLGQWLGGRGSLPPEAAAQLGNVVLASFSIAGLRRLFRS
jgi:lipopolysaccharide export LptBFGC system permease protein LptF